MPNNKHPEWWSKEIEKELVKYYSALDEGVENEDDESRFKTREAIKERWRDLVEVMGKKIREETLDRAISWIRCNCPGKLECSAEISEFKEHIEKASKSIQQLKSK